MSKFVARLKPTGHKVQNYSIEGVRFRRGDPWVGVDDPLAKLLRGVHENHLDPGSPKIFDVVSRSEAEREYSAEVEEMREPSPAEAPVVISRSSAPRADELMIDGYAALNVKQIVRKLERGSFNRSELEDIKAYEQAHAKRKTVLRALAEIMGA